VSDSELLSLIGLDLCDLFYQASSADYQSAVSELLQELQDVKDETSATKEQLDSYKESCSRLQEELQVCHIKWLISVHTYYESISDVWW